MRKLFLFLILFTTSVAADQFPIVIDPVANATPPGAKVSAGYLTLINESQKPFTITGAYSPDIAKVEIHLSSVVNDVAKMEKQETISIEPGATLKFEHGSYHIMLMELIEPLKENDSIDVILITSNGDMLIEMPVQKLGTSMKMQQHDNMSKHKDQSDTAEAHTGKENEEQSDNKNGAKKEGDTQTEAIKVVH